MEAAKCESRLRQAGGENHGFAAVRANGGAGHALPVLGRLGKDAAGSAAPGLGYEKGLGARGCPEGALSGAERFILASALH